MTKKHFKALASVISGIKDDKERGEVAYLIGHVCVEMNPRFNWEKWFDACEVKKII